MRKKRGMCMTQEYPFEVYITGDSFIVMEFIAPQVRCSVKLFPAFN